MVRVRTRQANGNECKKVLIAMLFKVARHRFHSVCAHAGTRFLGHRDACTHEQFLILQNLDFVNFSALLFSLFLQFPSVNFFKFCNTVKPAFICVMKVSNLLTRSYNIFLPKKTTYFNITEILARLPPFFFS